jgi:hypothetical protein
MSAPDIADAVAHKPSGGARRLAPDIVILPCATPGADIVIL